MGKIKIGLFGFGVVGQGIYEVVRKSKNANAEIVKICVRSLDKPRSIDRSHFTDSPAEILDNPEIDLIVEAPDRSTVAIEVRLTDTIRPADVEHLTGLPEQRAGGGPHGLHAVDQGGWICDAHAFVHTRSGELVALSASNVSRGV